MLRLLLRYQLRRTTRFFEKNRAAKSITALLFVGVFFLLSLGVYALFRAGFHYVAKDVYFGEALSVYIIELFLLVSFVLVIASALISGIFALYRNDDGALLMSSPYYQLKPFLVFVRMFTSSLWPLLVIILPGLIALREVFGLSGVGFLLSLLAVMLLIALAVLLAMVVLLDSALLLSFVNLATRKNIMYNVIGSFLLFLFYIWERFHDVDLVEFFHARVLEAPIAPLVPIFDQFHVFPSHAALLTIYFTQHGNMREAFISLAGLTAIVLFSVLAVYLLGKKYLLLWQLAQEGEGARKSGVLARSVGPSLTRSAGTVLSAMFRKEVVAFTRNSRGQLWLGFIVLIWAMQTASNFLLLHGLGAERVSSPFAPSVVGILQFVVVLYFVAMFVLRFAFPSFSVERKTAWIIGSAPVPLGTVFVAKLFFFGVLFSTLAAMFVSLNALILGLSFETSTLLIFGVMSASFFLTVLGLTIGAIFPNDETDDPEVLTTTLPGLGFILGTIIYGALGAFCLRALLVHNTPVFFIAFILCSFVGIFALTFLARKATVSLSLE